MLLISLLAAAFFAYKVAKNINTNFDYTVGQALDSLDGVVVYFNGGIGNVEGRNLTQDGYNLGLKYQCVEFVKRYYYEHYNHKMPDSYGHARSFFNEQLKDGQLNKARALIQYTNGSVSKPQKGDLLVFSGSLLNKYGHVAIISNVGENEIEIIQQNPGPFAPSRENMNLNSSDNKWTIESSKTLGWLRKEN